MAQKPETVFRKRVSAALKELPNTVFFPIQQKTIVGDPDYLLCVAGHFVALELKSELGKVSSLQRYKLDRVSAAGGSAMVAHPDTWPGIFLALQILANSKWRQT